MGSPVKHIPVKLIVGLISNRPSSFVFTKRHLERRFGRVDMEMEAVDFSFTRYYDEEFGVKLKRRFLSFEKPIMLEGNHKIKLFTGVLEERQSVKGARVINIDPGYISPSKLVLFTTKDRSHRVYIDKGIYAELELMFSKGSFRPLEWTFMDFRQACYVEYFNSVREIYLEQIKKHLQKM
ncbi:MAG: DUF4416 family protein [Candidatus Omnitrophota bacterium]